MSTCRSCGAKIIWAKMPSGKLCPFDPEPSRVGTHTITDGVASPCAKALIMVSMADPAKEFTSPLVYLSHFATCPNAGQHRKKRP